MSRSPLTISLLIGGAFLVLVALVFFFRSDNAPQQITVDQIEDVQPTAENVDPTFHARLMALRQEVEDAPSDTSKLLELAHLYQDAHQLAEAATVYEQILAVAPEHRQAHLDLALCYSQLGQWESAQGAMERLLARYPDDPSALYNLGAIQANDGNYDEAERIWKRVQAQTADIHLASQASASLEQLEALRLAPPTPTGSTPPTLPSDHPTIPADDYIPVIAGQ